MSCPNTKSIDIFSLGTYLDHSGAIFGYMMDFTDNKLDPKWQIIDFHRFYTRTVCPRLLSMGENIIIYFIGAGHTIGFFHIKAILGGQGHMAKV